MLQAYDEKFYLSNHSDVADAVRRGDWPSGHTHFAVDGRRKGRVAAPNVDEAWYSNTYPLVGEDIAAGKAGSPSEHYFALGRWRGYLPSPLWRRPDNPAATHSRFGGLWTDVGNALDVIDGRLDIGQINAAQASLLRKWVKDGYVVIEGAIPEPVLQAAEQALDDAYHGRIPAMRYAVHGVAQDCPWVEDALTAPAKALDLHWFSPQTRDLIFSQSILDFLHLVFERRALATQTLGFWRGSSQDGHQDSAYVNYTLPMQFAASWIALEDVHEGAGELFYYVGSHKLPEYYYAGEFKGAEVAKQVKPGVDLSKDYPRHIELIRRQTEGLGMPKQTFLARRGDVLIWSADLAHGGSVISSDRTRKSVVTHYCPKDVMPAYFENHAGYEIRSHHGQAFYASSRYR